MKRIDGTGPSNRTEGLEHEAEFQRGMEKHFLRRAMDLAAEGELDLSLAALGVSRTASLDAEALSDILSAEHAAQAAKEARLAANERMGGIMDQMLLNMPFGKLDLRLDEETLAAMQARMDEVSPIVILDTHPYGVTPAFKDTPPVIDVVDGMISHREGGFPGGEIPPAL